MPPPCLLPPRKQPSPVRRSVVLQRTPSPPPSFFAVQPTPKVDGPLASVRAELALRRALALPQCLRGVVRCRSWTSTTCRSPAFPGHVGPATTRLAHPLDARCHPVADDPVRHGRTGRRRRASQPGRRKRARKNVRAAVATCLRNVVLSVTCYMSDYLVPSDTHTHSRTLSLSVSRRPSLPPTPRIARSRRRSTSSSASSATDLDAQQTVLDAFLDADAAGPSPSRAALARRPRRLLERPSGPASERAAGRAALPLPRRCPAAAGRRAATHAARASSAAPARGHRRRRERPLRGARAVRALRLRGQPARVGAGRRRPTRWRRASSRRPTAWAPTRPTPAPSGSRRGRGCRWRSTSRRRLRARRRCASTTCAPSRTVRAERDACRSRPSTRRRGRVPDLGIVDLPTGSGKTAWSLAVGYMIASDLPALRRERARQTRRRGGAGRPRPGDRARRARGRRRLPADHFVQTAERLARACRRARRTLRRRSVDARALVVPARATGARRARRAPFSAASARRPLGRADGQAHRGAPRDARRGRRRVRDGRGQRRRRPASATTRCSTPPQAHHHAGDAARLRRRDQHAPRLTWMRKLFGGGLAVPHMLLSLLQRHDYKRAEACARHACLLDLITMTPFRALVRRDLEAMLPASRARTRSARRRRTLASRPGARERDRCRPRSPTCCCSTSASTTCRWPRATSCARSSTARSSASRGCARSSSSSSPRRRPRRRRPQRSPASAARRSAARRSCGWAAARGVCGAVPGVLYGVGRRAHKVLRLRVVRRLLRAQPAVAASSAARRCRSSCAAPTCTGARARTRLADAPTEVMVPTLPVFGAYTHSRPTWRAWTSPVICRTCSTNALHCLVHHGFRRTLLLVETCSTTGATSPGAVGGGGESRRAPACASSRSRCEADAGRRLRQAARATRSRARSHLTRTRRRSSLVLRHDRGFLVGIDLPTTDSILAVGAVPERVLTQALSATAMRPNELRDN